MSAPFAFLGSTHDAQLKSVFTDITLADVLVERSYTAAIWDDAMADNSPLLRTIARYLDETMLAQIGRAYAMAGCSWWAPPTWMPRPR